MQHFQVRGALRPIDCFALGEYHKYWLDKEAKIKNPAFDGHSSRLLSLKVASNPHFASAAKHLGDELLKAMRASGLPPGELLIVPSSREGVVSAGLERIVKRVVGEDSRFGYRAGALARVKAIPKLATGGDRSIDNHMRTIRYAEHPRAPLVKYVLDDISTTGNSLAACSMLIHQTTDEAVVRCLVLGKTVHE